MNKTAQTDEFLAPKALLKRFRKAKDRRSQWEAHWQECYDFALPLRDAVIHTPNPGEKKGDRLFDGTAPDAVDQLAAALLSELTPPWAQWFGLTAGPELEDEDRKSAGQVLDRIGAAMQSHFDRSNFAVEIHQCYMDLVTAGTACLLFEEAQPGESSAFRFVAVPLAQAVLEEGPDGKLDSTFRRSELTLAALRLRFPNAELDESLIRRGEEDPQNRFPVIEAVLPNQRGHYDYAAFLEEGDEAEGLLAQGRFAQSPFINFRWLKAPGEIYGRSPVMKTLPDIKTANKVVELVLKNATIAVTGIWQADDDGVLNPANIKLAPGTIIPKAVGSAGLQPLESPGRFDISQLVLDDLRSRIRRSMLVDKLGQPDSPKMTATEVLERSAEMARLLGASFGRLQSELLTPLILRALTILRRRGEIPQVLIDGRVVDLQYRSPLAQSQGQRDAQNMLTWLSALVQLGPEGMQSVDAAAAAQWLGRAFNVPSELMVVPSVAPPPDPSAAPPPDPSVAPPPDPSAAPPPVPIPQAPEVPNAQY